MLHRTACEDCKEEGMHGRSLLARQCAWRVRALVWRLPPQGDVDGLLTYTTSEQALCGDPSVMD
jgi:hypothetical protein